MRCKDYESRYYDPLSHAQTGKPPTLPIFPETKRKLLHSKRLFQPNSSFEVLFRMSAQPLPKFPSYPPLGKPHADIRKTTDIYDPPEVGSHFGTRGV